jgi:flagellar basal body-associated protein FliL
MFRRKTKKSKKNPIVIIILLIVLIWFVYQTIDFVRFGKYRNDSTYCEKNIGCGLYECSKCANNIWLKKNIAE